MDYEEWIVRERRLRIKALLDSPLVQEQKTCRVCEACGEICLCHEETCPNCDSGNVFPREVADVEAEVLGGKRIRCRFRFYRLKGTEGEGETGRGQAF